MAEVVWTEPALADLDAIADYIAMENPAAAAALVDRVYAHVGQLIDHPESGSKPPELGESTRHRQGSSFRWAVSDFIHQAFWKLTHGHDWDSIFHYRLVDH